MIHDLAHAAAAATDRRDLWVRLCRARSVRRMAEIGVWRGQFAAQLLHELPEVTAYHLVDPWRPLESWAKPSNVVEAEFEAIMREALAVTAFAGDKVIVLRGTTAEVADRLPDGSLDLAYIDGDHTLRGITIDLMRLLRKVRPGGLIGGDDYSGDPWHHGPGHEPTLVCPFARYFAEAADLPFVALPFGQFAILNQPDGYSFTNLSGAPSRASVGRPGSFAVRTASRTAKMLWARLQRMVGG